MPDLPDRQIAHRWFKIRDDVHWALWCLAKADAHEVVDRPLHGTEEAQHEGWACVSRTYSDGRYDYRVIRITEAGREELADALVRSREGPT